MAWNDFSPRVRTLLAGWKLEGHHEVVDFLVQSGMSDQLQYWSPVTGPKAAAFRCYLVGAGHSHSAGLVLIGQAVESVYLRDYRPYLGWRFYPTVKSLIEHLRIPSPCLWGRPRDATRPQKGFGLPCFVWNAPPRRATLLEMPLGTKVDFFP